MTRDDKLYWYCGPKKVYTESVGKPLGRRISNSTELVDFLLEQEGDVSRGIGTFSFILSKAGELRLASRRSEHVACAGRRPILSAGEITFEQQKSEICVDTITNQSMGYCPEPESWPAVEVALSEIAIPFPAYWTTAFQFRKCIQCGEHSILKDYDPFCPFCGTELPDHWNIAPTLVDL